MIENIHENHVDSNATDLKTQKEHTELSHIRFLWISNHRQSNVFVSSNPKLQIIQENQLKSCIFDFYGSEIKRKHRTIISFLDSNGSEIITNKFEFDLTSTSHDTENTTKR